MKHLLLVGLLIIPLLAQADPLNNGALAVLAYVYLALVGLAVFALLLVVLAFLRPRSQGLQVAQVLALLLFAFLYLMGGRFTKLFGNEWNAAFDAILPLGLMLNGLTQAKRAKHPLACQAWAGLAVAGSAGVLWPLVGTFHINQLWVLNLQSVALRKLWELTLVFFINVPSWLLVLRVLRRHPVPATTLWQSWWAAPASAAGVAAGYYVLSVYSLLINEPMLSLNIVSLAPGALLTAVSCWLAGVAMLRLVRPLGLPQEVVAE